MGRNSRRKAFWCLTGFARPLSDIAVAIHPKSLRLDRRLYVLAALGAVLVVFAGFAKTYYLKLALGTPSLSLLVHAHGLVMTTWFVLFVVQTQLVAAGRTDLHRRLGVFGAALAVAVLVVGAATAITAAKLGHSPGPPPLQFLVVPFGDLLVFLLLVSLGLAYRRRRTDIHKRMMLLSCVGLLTAAIARIPWQPWLEAGIPAYFSTTILLVLICVIYDTIKHRHLHPAFGWGAALIIVSWPLRLVLSGTPQWQQFATWATQ